MMKRKIISILAFAAVCFHTAAQNLNPTVEVTNTYKGKLMEINKPAFEMAVPDSLLKFDLKFDYSIFDRPYKGAYAFSPYVMDMKPNPDAYKAKNLYLRAGAGYYLRPVLDFVYSHGFKNGLALNAYAFHESYAGPYINIGALSQGGKVPALLPKKALPSGAGNLYSTHKGHDMLTRAGINGRYDWKKVSMSFDIGYYGVHAEDTLMRSSMDVLAGKIGFRTRKNTGSYFFYDALASLKVGTDRFYKVDPGIKTLMFNEFELSGTFGPVMEGKNKILVDAYILGLLYNSLFSANSGILALTPRYEYNKDRWRLSLGVKLSLLSRAPSFFEDHPVNDNPGQIVYPNVYIGYEALKERLNLYLKLSGGDGLNSYMYQKGLNHFFNPFFGRKRSALAENTAERFNFSAGAEGNISSLLRFDFRAGYAVYSRGRIETLYYSSLDGGLPKGSLGGVVFNDYNLFYTTLNAVWDKDPWSIEGRLNFMDADIYRKKTPGFGPSLFSGRLKGRYNWSRRIYAGLYTDFATSRRGFIRPLAGAGEAVEVLIPGFVDLGFFTEYKLNKKFSLWLDGGNLLNSNIQRSPLYPEGGLSITAGICLNL